jgi:phage shock protein A
LPELKDSTTELTLVIKDAGGNIVRSFTSKADSNYKKYDGAPAEEPVLSKNKGVNRFVWDMRYTTIPGVQDVYVEGSYRGHKAAPGNYAVTLKKGAQSATTTATILANPLYTTTAAEYQQYNEVMTAMEQELTTMYNNTNTMHSQQQQLESVLASLPADEKYVSAKTAAQDLVKKMKSWDEDMVQRKSKAYDDAENFPAKFLTDYQFLVNQTESEIPHVNQPSLDLQKELNAQWAKLKTRRDEIVNTIPVVNKMFWDAGLGVIWKK